MLRMISSNWPFRVGVITLVRQALGKSVILGLERFSIPSVMVIANVLFLQETVPGQSMKDIKCKWPSLVTGHFLRSSCKTALLLKRLPPSYLSNWLSWRLELVLTLRSVLIGPGTSRSVQWDQKNNTNEKYNAVGRNKNWGLMLQLKALNSKILNIKCVGQIK